MDDGRRGLAFGAAAYLLWGLFPLYWPLLEPAGAVEILTHRILWSLVFVGLLLWARGALRTAWAVFRQRGRVLALAALVITVNWFTYIWGVNAEHVVETSLGYFINPLFTILLGVVVLHERLRPGQWAAVGVGTLAIAVLAVDYGRPPWIALTLATSFALYGFFKKRAGVGAVESLAVETGLLAVPALLVLAAVAVAGDWTFGTASPAHTSLMVGTGIVTAVPLILFGAAATRLPLSVIGMLQYLAPVLQFAVGVGIRHEPMSAARWIGFGFVWLALVVLTVEGIRHQRGVALARAAESVS